MAWTETPRPRYERGGGACVEFLAGPEDLDHAHGAAAARARLAQGQRDGLGTCLRGRDGRRLGTKGGGITTTS